MRTPARLSAYVATSALLLTGTALVGPAAQADTDPVGVQAGSSWLVAQTRDGLLQSGYDDNGTWVTYDDQGLTIDAVESLVESGQQPAAVQAMTDAVEAQASTYASYGSGQVAKLLVLAELAGRDPASFGPGGLLADLEAAVDTTTGNEGALTGAYDSVIGQALAARALRNGASVKAGDVTEFLLDQQCTPGYFRESFATAGGCQDGVSAADVDTTAIAVLQLAQTPATPAVTAALGSARTWLAAQQQGDGSWLAFGAGNANSTGLAARALGDSPAAAKAATWLWNHQARQGGPAKLAAETGAVAVDDAAWSDGMTYGLDERSRTLWVRATAQSVAALRWLPSSLTGKLTLSAPTGYRKAGSALVLTTSGTRSGHVLTLTGPGVNASATSSGATWSRKVTLPAGTATRTYSVRDDHGHSARRSVKVLGAKTLRVRAGAYRVKRGRYVTAQITGLASKEPAALHYRGRIVKRGVASSSGVYRARFAVGRSTGIKRVIGLGAFSDIRRGSTKIRVVR